MQVGEVLVCQPLGGKVGTSVLLCPMCGAPSSQQWFLRGFSRGNHQGGEGSWGAGPALISFCSSIIESDSQLHAGLPKN